MINAYHAKRLREAFGSCSTVFECMTDAEIVNAVNAPAPKDEDDWEHDGFDGDFEDWAESELAVNEILMGFNWNENRSDAYNEKAKAENEAWLAEVAKNVRAEVKAIQGEIDWSKA